MPNVLHSIALIGTICPDQTNTITGKNVEFKSATRRISCNIGKSLEPRIRFSQKIQLPLNEVKANMKM